MEGMALQCSNTQPNRLQVLHEILLLCREPQTKVQILEETGVSIRHLHFCLKHLLKQNILRFHHRKKTYLITEKGLKYIQLRPEIQRDS